MPLNCTQLKWLKNNQTKAKSPWGPRIRCKPFYWCPEPSKGGPTSLSNPTSRFSHSPIECSIPENHSCAQDLTPLFLSLPPHRSSGLAPAHLFSDIILSTTSSCRFLPKYPSVRQLTVLQGIPHNSRQLGL